MREQLIIGGFGGQGVLLLGEIIARAAIADGKETVCVPAYGPEVRGGFAHSTVIISDQQIGAVTVSEPDTLIVMNQTSLERFLSQLRQGGWLFVNTSLVEPPELGAGVVVPLPATEIAEEMGNVRVANSVMLGAYVAGKGVVSEEASLEALSSGLRGRAKELAEMNVIAYRKGLALGLCAAGEGESPR